MIHKVFVAHNSNPGSFRHEFNIDFIGSDDMVVVQEIVDLLNLVEFRDCSFKIVDDEQAKEKPVCHREGNPICMKCGKKPEGGT